MFQIHRRISHQKLSYIPRIPTSFNPFPEQFLPSHFHSKTLVVPVPSCVCLPLGSPFEALRVRVFLAPRLAFPQAPAACSTFSAEPGLSPDAATHTQPARLPRPGPCSLPRPAREAPTRRRQDVSRSLRTWRPALVNHPPTTHHRPPATSALRADAQPFPAVR